MSIERERQRNTIKAVRLLKSGWYGYLLQLGSFPLAQEHRPELATVMHQLVTNIRRSIPAERSVWLLLDELHREDAVQEISRNAATWNPEPGLGVRPEGPSPQYWTSEHLLDRDFTTEMPPAPQTVMGLETDEAGAELACSQMAGRGALIQVLHHGTTTTLVDEWHAYIQPTIPEEGLAAYTQYVPILSVKTLKTCGPRDLDRWLGPAIVYLRESAEDQGIVVLSKHPLEQLLRVSGISIPD